MHGTALPELPTLSPGVQLLDTDGRATGPLAALVVDQVIGADGPAVWVDSRGHAQTGPLLDVAPSDRVLDRIRVARGFTAHQHFALVQSLPEQIDEDTALLVLPAMDAPYRDDVGQREGERLCLRSLATVARIAREYDVPVLLTRTGTDAVADALATAADRTVECRQTALGPRFVTDEFETQVYPRGDGTVQTTLAFWRRVLAARCAGVETPETATETRPEVVFDGAH
ncbi:hypothetical protein [Halorientalis salina]|uniref:hypothetical protein n=1 Tax=Halorientalis salina TaxID=2932266 RepID=UPI0010AC3D83|nr:hypothetical protein [Halorientalis salina]